MKPPSVISGVSRSPLAVLACKHGQIVQIDGVAYTYDKPADRLRVSDEKRAEPTDHRNSRAIADVEPDTGDAPVAAVESPAFHSRVHIEVVSFRWRLADPDGVSAKAAIDGLVNCGILRDDSAKEVASVSYRQVKVKTREEEKTRIVVTPVHP